MTCKMASDGQTEHHVVPAPPWSLTNLRDGAVLAIVLVFFGRWFIRPTRETASGELQIVGDALEYIQMAREGLAGVPEPFRFRLLTPWLASLFPDEVQGLHIVTLVGLFLFYLATYMALRQQLVSKTAAALAVVLVFSAFWHQFNYFDPYLTDGLALGLNSAFVLLALQGALLSSFAVVMVAVINRETSVSFVPLWVVLRPRSLASWVAPVAAIFLVFIVRHASGPGSSLTMLHWSGPVSWVGLVFLSWGGLWGLAALGAVLGLPSRPRFVGGLLALTGAMAVASSLFATDVPRMFQIMAPSIAFGVGASLQALQARKSWLVPLWFAAAGLHIVFGGMPNRIVDTHAMRGLSGLQVAMEIMLLLLAVFTWLALRRELATALRQSWPPIKLLRS